MSKQVCVSVCLSQVLHCFFTETLPGVLLVGDRRQLLCTAGPDPGSDWGPGGTAAPGPNRDRGPEAGVRAAPGHQGPPGKGNRDLLPPDRWRWKVSDTVCKSSFTYLKPQPSAAALSRSMPPRLFFFILTAEKHVYLLSLQSSLPYFVHHSHFLICLGRPELSLQRSLFLVCLCVSLP